MLLTAGQVAALYVQTMTIFVQDLNGVDFQTKALFSSKGRICSKLTPPIMLNGLWSRRPVPRLPSNAGVSFVERPALGTRLCLSVDFPNSCTIHEGDFVCKP